VIVTQLWVWLWRNKQLSSGTRPVFAEDMFPNKQGYHRFRLKNKDNQKKNDIYRDIILFKRQHKCQVS